jgi:hypothetical protein
MLLHANAVAKDCATGVGTGWIDGDNAERVFLFAIMLGQLIDKSAFAGSGSPCDTYSQGFARVREQFFEQLNPSGCVVLDGRNSAG